ncbi:bifunctional hydroxymethylpyrimidine kinase/phosphomethylpyrimidine kinase, partial [Pseudomonas sp. TNT11]
IGMQLGGGCASGTLFTVGGGNARMLVTLFFFICGSLIATPNLPEARILAELPEGTADECAERLLPFIKHLLITGGHGDEHQVHNRLYSRDGTRQTFTCQRLPGSYHGSGCTLASALAGRIAQGEGLVSAVQSALNYTWRTLRDAEQLGQGQFVPRRLPLDFCS